MGEPFDGSYLEFNRRTEEILGGLARDEFQSLEIRNDEGKESGVELKSVDTRHLPLVTFSSTALRRSANLFAAAMSPRAW